jgi:iron-sulfur cluster assembly accessory protein
MTDIFAFHEPITITELAAKMVLETMQREGMDPDAYSLRIGVTGGGCSGLQYLLDFTNTPNEESDWVYRQHGIKIAVDQFSAGHLMGTTVDYTDGLNGSGFKFENPNVTRKCGCGSSFA